MAKVLLATGHFTWDAVERRSDRYGSVRLQGEKDSDILLDSALDALEGKKGRLFAEVIIPVKSPHMGDLARGFRPTTPNKGEIVVLGEGELFIEHRGQAVHEKSELERDDEKFFNDLELSLIQQGVKVTRDEQKPDPEIYDLVGLKPDDGRNRDWLNPKSFYRLHLSKVNLFFEEF